MGHSLHAHAFAIFSQHEPQANDAGLPMTAVHLHKMYLRLAGLGPARPSRMICCVRCERGTLQATELSLLLQRV